jgi:hypothetical protein
MVLKKTLINFAMIQAVILANSVNIGLQLPTSNGYLIAIGFVYILISMFSFIPSIVVSFAFAALSERK